MTKSFLSDAAMHPVYFKYGELVPGMFNPKLGSLIISVIRHPKCEIISTISIWWFNVNTKKISCSNAGQHVYSSFKKNF